MAVQDLTRHLGIGWQTLTSVVGTIAVIGLAEDGKLPPQLAVSAAVAVAFWGILNIMDASFWATRAIAFLANVEAVYLYEPERRVFNPYVGRHPSLKVFDSLEYQLYAAFVMLGLSCVYYLKKIADSTNDFRTLLPALKNHSYSAVFFWTVPGFVFLFMLERALTGRHKRTADYRAFVTDCPGPGLVRDPTVSRGMNLVAAIDPSKLVLGADLQESVRKGLDKRERVWRWLKWVGRISCWIGIAGMIVLIVLKNRVT